jgi:hypothetical protein
VARAALPVNTAAIIDSEQEVEGYPPVTEPTCAAFDKTQWNLDCMTPR